MISPVSIRLGWTIAQAIWLANRRSFVALVAAAGICGVLFRTPGLVSWSSDALNALGYIPMGLSLFLTFVFCGFNESDRKERDSGFPSRLFTLPVATRTLIAAPVLFGVAAVGAVYLVWAGWVLPGLGRELPLSWPLLYLATGMVCYQVIVWSLARRRIARLFVLGCGGTILAIGWLAFLDGTDTALILAVSPDRAYWVARPALCAMLVVLGIAAFLVGHVAVESQRRGGVAPWLARREGDVSKRRKNFLEPVSDAFPRSRKPFDSPGRAQWWFEWRRHGSLLPLATAGVLLVIMAPAPFLSPISAGTTLLMLGWISATPLLLAFGLGKGFGKADLWSKEPGPPLFLATRPLSNLEWIGAKMKVAAFAALISWLVVVALTTVWLWFWCDSQQLLAAWEFLKASYSTARLCFLPFVLFGVMVLLTFRFLVDSLYIGLSGKAWMLHAATFGVFLAFVGVIFASISLRQNPASLKNLLNPPAWLVWLWGGCFTMKIVGAFLLANGARRRGWITSRSINRYALLWVIATSLLILVVRVFFPFDLIILSGVQKAVLILLVLSALPLLRISFAPIALVRSRTH